MPVGAIGQNPPPPETPYNRVMQRASSGIRWEHDQILMGLLVVGYMERDMGHGTWDTGHGTWDTGHGTQHGTWDMGHGTWDMGHGMWDMGCGTWDMGRGTWDKGCETSVDFTNSKLFLSWLPQGEGEADLSDGTNTHHGGG